MHCERHCARCCRKSCLSISTLLSLGHLTVEMGMKFSSSHAGCTPLLALSRVRLELESRKPDLESRRASSSGPEQFFGSQPPKRGSAHQSADPHLKDDSACLLL